VLNHQPPELLIWDKHVRWVICKRDLPAGSRRFSFFNCTQAAEIRDERSGARKA
jgi:hypothetical protein